MKIVLYILLQWTWGIIQNVFGLICILFQRKTKHFFYHGAVVTFWSHKTCMGLGMFIFMSKNIVPKSNRQEIFKNTDVKNILMHEYGHTLQSIILGPFFLLIVGMPSFIWAKHPYFQKLRKERNIPYCEAYQEKWADKLGELVFRNITD